MVYVRRRVNIRKPIRRRASVRRPIRRRAPVRRRTHKCKPCRSVKELTPTSRFALAQLDPFEPRANGCKIPDSNTMPSISNNDIDLIPFNPPGTSGYLVAAAYAPSYASSVINSTDVSASACAWPIAYNSTRRNYTNVVASIEAIRPVAHAIRLSSALAPTTATGFVHLGLSVESRKNGTTGGGAVPDFPKSVNEMTGLAHYKRVTLASLTQSPLTVLNKWIDETAFRYEDPRAQRNYISEASDTLTDTTFNFFGGWASIIVYYEGAPLNLNPISVEHLLLTECLPQKNSFIIGSQAAPNSPATMAATSQMQAQTEFSHTEAQQPGHIQRSVNAFAEGAAQAGTEFENAVVIPLLQRAGYAVAGTALYMGTMAGGRMMSNVLPVGQLN